VNEHVQGAGTVDAPSGFGPWGRRLLTASRTVAVIGSLVFVALVAMSIVNIVGRKLAAAPIPGDVEILQMCAAFATASFFGYCHLVGGDVKVDFFTSRARSGVIRALDAFGSVMFGAVGSVLAWRSLAGALAVRSAGETSVILGWPVWVAQMLMVPGFVLMGLAGFYMAGVYLRMPVARAAHEAAA